jgi:uncharacterized protein (DUF608 family)
MAVVSLQPMAKKKGGNGRSKRRDFLKTVALAGGAGYPAASGQTQAPAGASSAPAAAPRASHAIEYPRKFTGRQLARIAFPLGGVAAGSISLGGRGQLRDWEIFNRPDKGNSPRYAFAAIWVTSGAGKPIARVAEARIQPPYEGSSGLSWENAPGLPRLESATFIGEFPIATVDFHDPELPVSVTLEAFTPFIPLDADESGLPIAILRYRARNARAQSAKVSLSFSLDNPVGANGRTNRYRKGQGFEGLLMQDPFAAAADPKAGTFALCVLNGNGGEVTYTEGWRGGSRWRVGPLLFWDDFSEDGRLNSVAEMKDTTGSICLQKDIPARASADFTFLLAWHLPNRTPERCGWTAPKGDERSKIGNFYCARFANAWAAAEYAVAHLDSLEARTRKFVEAIRNTSLPPAVREAAMANLSTLVAPTSFRTGDGEFHGFEGCNNSAGCCFGSCTHVWNYETATAFVFPSLSRSHREGSFGFSTDEEGRMDFRRLLPSGKEHYGKAAADGQMGQIIKLYIDWKQSGDIEWLRRLWPAARRALEFAWRNGGWDANRDGVMEGVQHNTYDVEFFGPNPLCQVWYLGALRASEELARALGDEAFAGECRSLFEQGSRWTDANLFNGEYYIQQVRGIPKDQVAPGLIVGMGAADTEHPDFQLGSGCLVDQLAGQYLAAVAGLGLLLDESKIRKTLESIYRYNYKRSLYRHESVQRTYALNDEAALVICDYPHGQRPENPFPYFAEVMTGFEYCAATLMLHQGMEAQGVELIGNIRRRYDGERRNPWNEAECGHHYARAMASWAAIPILSGFSYNGFTKELAASPRLKAEKFSSFWSTGNAWGTFQTSRGNLVVQTIEGALAVRSLTLPAAAAKAASSHVKLAGNELAHTAARSGRAITIQLSAETAVSSGESLVITA